MAVKQKFLELEALRGIAAMVVILYHFPSASPLYNNLVVVNGDVMVDMFFVISGFVICCNYFDRIGSVDELLSFQKKRFWRLYPLHFLTFLVFLGIDLLRIAGTGESGEGENSWLLAIFNVFLVQALFADELSYNFPSWSISTEFFTYLIFACIALLSGRFRTTCMIVAFIAAAFGCWYFDAFKDVVGYPLLRCLYGFFAGVLIYRIYANFKPGAFARLLSPLFWLIAAFAVTALYAYFPSWLPVIIFGFLIISLALHAGSNSLTPLLNGRLLQHLGKISYSIYMWHILIVSVLMRGMQSLFGYRGEFIPNVGIMLDMGITIATLATILYMICVVAISTASFSVVEMRFTQRKG